MKREHEKRINVCRYFFADRGYDSTNLIQWLNTEGIAPIIDIRNQWKGDETKQFKDIDLVYSYNGKVNFVNKSGEKIELLYRGYDKSRDCNRYGFHPKYHDKNESLEFH